MKSKTMMWLMIMQYAVKHSALILLYLSLSKKKGCGLKLKLNINIEYSNF